MSEPRFYVQEIWGWLAPREGKTEQAPGVTAHVFDRLYNSKLVAMYRSEDEARRRPCPPDTRDAAIAHAAEHAARLNAEDARAASGAAR